MHRAVALWFFLASNSLFADQPVITSDGRDVLLKANGTWEFRSADRYATTADGRHVRLKADHSWQYIENLPPHLQAKTATPAEAFEVSLQKVVIEKHVKKVLKNTRLKTQTVFYVDLTLSELAGNDIDISNTDKSRISVSDNNGMTYPVLVVQADAATLTPGSSTTIAVRVDKSPAWLDNAKSMEIIFKPGIFGLERTIKLTRQVDDFEEEDVDGFVFNE